MASEDVTVKIKVQTDGSVRETTQVAAGLEHIADAGKKAAKAGAGLKTEFVQVAGAFTAIAIGKQVRDTLIGLAAAADEAEKGMGRIRTVLDENIVPATQVRQVIQAVAVETGASFEDLSTTVRDLIAQGLNPAQVATEEFLGSLSRFQRVAEIDGTRVSQLVKALGNMGITGTQVSPALDQIASVADASSLEMKDFTNVLLEAGAVATNTGQNFKDIAATAALVSSGFRTGQIEATTLRNALVFLSSPKKRQKIIDAFGIDIFDKAGQLRRLPEVLMEIVQKVPKEKFNLFNEILGTKQGGVLMQTALNNLTNGMQIAGQEGVKGAAIFEQFQGIIEGSAGSVNEKFGKVMANLTDQFARLEQGGKGILTNFLGPFLSLITSVVSGIASLMGGISSFMAAHPMLAAVNGTLLAVVGSAALAVSAMLTLGGGLKLAGFAMTFLRTSIAGGVAAMGHARLAAALTTGRIGMMGTMAVGASVGIRTLGVAFRALRTAMLGPLGIALLLFEGIPLLLDLFSGSSKSKTNDAQRLVETQSNVADKQAQVAQQYSEVTQKLGKIVDQFTGAALKEFPFFDQKNLNVLDTVLNNAAKLDRTLQPAQLDQMSAVVGEFMTAVRSGTQTPQQLDRAVISLQQAIGFAAQQERAGVGGAAGRKKALVGLLEQVEASVSPQAALFARRREALQTPGGSIFGAQGEDVVSIPPPGQAATANAPQSQFSGFNGGINLTKLPDNMNVKASTVQSATFNNVEFRGNVSLNVDGEAIRANVRSGNTRDSAANMGGA